MLTPEVLNRLHKEKHNREINDAIQAKAKAEKLAMNKFTLKC